MCCDGSPDPSIEKELNAYVSLWSEDDVAQKEIGSILNECEQTRKVLSMFVYPLLFVLYCVLVRLLVS